MAGLASGRLVILKKDGSDGIIYLPHKKTSISIGRNITNDIRLNFEGIQQTHFRITVDSAGTIRALNLCKESPILVNDEVVETKRKIKSGDIINLMGKKMRWESKADVKRKTVDLGLRTLAAASASNSEKKPKTRCLKTKNRVTIHSVCQSENQSYTETIIEKAKTSPTKDTSKSDLDKSTPFSTPTLGISLNKENFSSPKLEILNRSEILLTSYTPQLKSAKTASVNTTASKIRTPRTMKTLAEKPETSNKLKSNISTPKSGLSVAHSNLVEFDSPVTAGQKKSMFLVDLITPLSAKSASTPTRSSALKSDSSTLKQKTTPARILLKSAIKNSTIKKRIDDASATSQGKALSFDEDPNITGQSTADESYLSSIIEISSSSFDDTMRNEQPTDENVVQIEAEASKELPKNVPENQSDQTSDTSNFEDLKKMMKTPRKTPKNDLRDVAGVRELLRTPRAEPKDGLTDAEGVENLLKTPDKSPNNDLMNVTGVAQLMKTPGLSSAQNATGPSDGVMELLESISSVLVENDVANVSEGSLDLTANGKKTRDTENGSTVAETASTKAENASTIVIPPSSERMSENTRTMEIESNFDKIFEEQHSGSTNPQSSNSIAEETNFETMLFEEVIKDEMETIDKKFDELIGRPPVTKMYPAKKSNDQEEASTSVGTSADVKQKEQERGERVLKWIEEVQESLIGGNNKTEQILSSRYSNVTPNDSIMQSAEIVSSPVDVQTPKVSILETVQHLQKTCFPKELIDNAKGKFKLTMSPVTRLSFMENSTEVLENYQLQGYKEITTQKSLRSTRKRIGNAMASLHNLSQVANTTLDPNESLNQSTEDCCTQENVAEPDDILSLDSQALISGDQQEPTDEYEVVSSNNFIQFVKTGDDSDDEELEKDVFEISSSHNSLDKGNQDSSESEESSETEEEEEECSQEEYDEELCQPEENDDTENLVNTDANSEIPEHSDGTAFKFRLSEKEFETGEDGIIPLEQTKTEVDNQDREVPKVSLSLLNETMLPETIESAFIEYPADIAEEDGNVSERSEVVHSWKESDQQLDCDDNENSEIFQNLDDTVIADDDGFNEIPATQEFSEDLIAVGQISEAQSFAETTVDTSREESLNPEADQPLIQTDQSPAAPCENELFSETEFSRVDINDDLMKTDNEDSVTENTNGDECDESSQLELEVDIEKELRNIEDQPIEEELKNIDDQPIEEELKSIDDQPALTRRGFSMLPIEVSEKSISSRRTLAQEKAVEDKFSESFNEYVEIQKELKNVSDQPFENVRAASLSPMKEIKPVESRKTLALEVPNNEKMTASFIEYVELKQELKNIDDKQQTSRRGVSLLSSEIQSKETTCRKTLTTEVVNEEASDSFIEYVELQQELKNIDDKQHTSRRGVSLLPSEIQSKETTSRKTLTTEVFNEEASDSFIEYVELQQELKNIDNKQQTSRRGVSLLPSEIQSQATTSRKTMTTDIINENASESFIEYVELRKELINVNDRPVEKRATSLSPEKQIRPGDIRKTIAVDIPSEDIASVSFIEHIEQEIELKDINDQPIIEKRGVSLMPEDAVTKTSSSRKTLASEPFSEEAPRRSFIEHVDQLKKILGCSEEPEIDEKSDQSEPLNTIPEQPQEVEAVEESSGKEAPFTEQILLKHEPIDGELDPKQSDEDSNNTAPEPAEPPKGTNDEDDDTQYKRMQPVIEKPCIKKHAYVTIDDQDDDRIPVTPSRRRPRVDYSQLASGSTPKKTATRRPGRSISIDSIKSFDGVETPSKRRGRTTANKNREKITEELANEVTEVSAEITITNLQEKEIIATETAPAYSSVSEKPDEEVKLKEEIKTEEIPEAVAEKAARDHKNGGPENLPPAFGNNVTIESNVTSEDAIDIASHDEIVQEVHLENAIVPKSNSRGRRGAQKTVEVTISTPLTERSKRGPKKKVDLVSEDANITIETQTKIPPKRNRGKKVSPDSSTDIAKPDEVEATQEIETPKVIAGNAEEASLHINKPKRGRMKKNIEPDPEKPSTPIVSKYIPAESHSSKKVHDKKANEAKSVEESSTSESMSEQVMKRTAHAKKTEPSNDSEAECSKKVDEKPVIKKRGRKKKEVGSPEPSISNSRVAIKRKAAENEKVIELSLEEQDVISEPVKKTRRGGRTAEVAVTKIIESHKAQQSQKVIPASVENTPISRGRRNQMPAPEIALQQTPVTSTISPEQQSAARGRLRAKALTAVQEITELSESPRRGRKPITKPIEDPTSTTVQEAPTKRGRRAKTPSIELDSTVPESSKRGRKAKSPAIQEVAEVDEPDYVVEKVGRRVVSKRNAEKEPQASIKTRGRPAKLEVEPDDVQEVPAKRGRTSKEAHSVEKEITKEPTPEPPAVRKGRGKISQDVEELKTPKQATKRLGRSTKQDTTFTQVTETKDDKQPEEHPKSSKTARRNAATAAAADEPIAKRSLRNRK